MHLQIKISLQNIFFLNLFRNRFHNCVTIFSKKFQETSTCWSVFAVHPTAKHTERKKRKKISLCGKKKQSRLLQIWINLFTHHHYQIKHYKNICLSLDTILYKQKTYSATNSRGVHVVWSASGMNFLFIGVSSVTLYSKKKTKKQIGKTFTHFKFFVSIIYNKIKSAFLISKSSFFSSISKPNFLDFHVVLMIISYINRNPFSLI